MKDGEDISAYPHFLLQPGVFKTNFLSLHLNMWPDQLVTVAIWEFWQQTHTECCVIRLQHEKIVTLFHTGLWKDNNSLSYPSYLLCTASCVGLSPLVVHLLALLRKRLVGAGTSNQMSMKKTRFGNASFIQPATKNCSHVHWAGIKYLKSPCFFTDWTESHCQFHTWLCSYTEDPQTYCKSQTFSTSYNINFLRWHLAVGDDN